MVLVTVFLGITRATFKARFKPSNIRHGPQDFLLWAWAARCIADTCHAQVGAIDADRIDLTWEAAMKHGFALVADSI